MAEGEKTRFMPQPAFHTTGEVQLASGVSSAPAGPFTEDLVSIAALHGVGGRSSQFGLIQIVKASGDGEVTLEGPVLVIGSCKGRVVEIGRLNASASVVIDSNIGYQELVQGVGLCDSVCLAPAGVSGGSYNAFLVGVSG